MAIAANKPFSSHIKTDFRFFNCKNCNIGIAAANIPVTGMLKVDYDVIVVAINRLVSFYINTGFCFSACKNYNIGVTATSILAISVPVVNMLVANCDITAVVISRLFSPHIKTSFCFSTPKNRNAKEVMLVTNAPIVGRPAIAVPATNMLVVSMQIVSVLVADVPIARAFLSNIFLTVFAFLIVKITTQG